MSPREEEEANNTAANNESLSAIVVGPDLNPSRTPLDHKLYRQILLPNGLRCVLISDTVAMHQCGGGYDTAAGMSGYESDSESSHHPSQKTQHSSTRV